MVIAKSERQRPLMWVDKLHMPPFILWDKHWQEKVVMRLNSVASVTKNTIYCKSLLVQLTFSWSQFYSWSKHALKSFLWNSSRISQNVKNNSLSRGHKEVHFMVNFRVYYITIRHVANVIIWIHAVWGWSFITIAYEDQHAERKIIIQKCIRVRKVTVINCKERWGWGKKFNFTKYSKRSPLY